LVACGIAACGDDGDGGTTGTVVGRAPMIDAQSDTSVVYGDTLRLVATARDPDGGPIEYSVAAFVTLTEIRTGYVALMRIDRDTGAFWFTPNSRDIPSRSFQFMATDEDGLTATDDFKVTAIVVE
jgi:hypothetical protein